MHYSLFIHYALSLFSLPLAESYRLQITVSKKRCEKFLLLYYILYNIIINSNLTHKKKLLSDNCKIFMPSLYKHVRQGDGWDEKSA